MTAWLCDRCGKQVGKDAYGAGKYKINKKCIMSDDTGFVSMFERTLKFCDECAMEMEKLLDDEFEGIPTQVMVEINKRI